MTGYPSSPSVHRSWVGVFTPDSTGSLRLRKMSDIGQRCGCSGNPNGTSATGSTSPIHELRCMARCWRARTIAAKKNRRMQVLSVAFVKMLSGSHVCWIRHHGQQRGNNPLVSNLWTDEISWKHCIALWCPFYTGSIINSLGCQIGLVHLICDITWDYKSWCHYRL